MIEIISTFIFSCSICEYEGFGFSKPCPQRLTGAELFFSFLVAQSPGCHLRPALWPHRADAWRGCPYLSVSGPVGALRKSPITEKSDTVGTSTMIASKKIDHEQGTLGLSVSRRVKCILWVQIRFGIVLWIVKSVIVVPAFQWNSFELEMSCGEQLGR